MSTQQIFLEFLLVMVAHTKQGKLLGRISALVELPGNRMSSFVLMRSSYPGNLSSLWVGGEEYVLEGLIVAASPLPCRTTRSHLTWDFPVNIWESRLENPELNSRPQRCLTSRLTLKSQISTSSYSQPPLQLNVPSSDVRIKATQRGGGSCLKGYDQLVAQPGQGLQSCASAFS